MRKSAFLAVLGAVILASQAAIAQSPGLSAPAAAAAPAAGEF